MIGRAAMVLTLTLPPAGAFSAAPAGASRASDQPGVVERAMELAPEISVGLVHIDVKSIVKPALAEIRKEKGLLAESLAEAVDKLAGKIDAVDLFLVPGVEEPLPLIVVHGKLGAADVEEALKAAKGPGLKKDDKGGYELAEGPPMRFVFGGEANDLPRGVVVAGMKNVATNDRVSGLGKGKNETLRRLLKEVDGSAEAFFALDGSAFKDEDSPQSLTGCLYLVGKGRSQGVLKFKETKFAEAFEKGFGKQSGPLADVFLPRIELKRDQAVVTLTTKSTDPVLGTFLEVVAQSQVLARRAASAANLRSIGAAVAMYMLEHNQQMPPDLVAMVKENMVKAEALISPSSGREMKVDDKGVPTVESDYVYLKYAKLPDKPADYIQAYEKPEINGKEGANVLYADGHVEWLKPEDFTKQLDKAKKLAAEQEGKKSP